MLTKPIGMAGTIAVIAPGVYTANVTYANVVNTVTGVSNLSITVTSTEDINVYAINYSSASTDASTILPVPAWGTDYRIASGGKPVNGSTAYIAIAKENGTTLTRSDGEQVTLNQNQAYHYFYPSVADSSGRRVYADKPIALFSGANGTYGPGQSGYCTGLGLGSSSGDHTFEQLWSTDKWGTDFFAWKVVTNGTTNWGGIIGVITSTADTHITVSGAINGGTKTYTLGANTNQYVCYAMTGLVRITSDKPIMAYTILPDAALTYIPPTEQRVNTAILSPFVVAGTTNITQHAVEILLPAAYWATTEIKENGVVVANTTYTVTTSTDFPDWITVRKEFANLDVRIDVDCPGGMLAYMYGYGSAETYGYVAGAASYNLQNYFTIRDRANTNDAHYSSTTTSSHTFDLIDIITIKRSSSKPLHRHQMVGQRHPI